jgi:PAS domain S-box-containing protein
MQADAPAAPLLLLSILTVTGLVWLAVAQRRALRRAAARAARLDEELVRYQHAEAESLEREERFRTPLDQTEDYTIFLLDPAGKATSWNSSVRRVLGYDRPEFLRRPVADLYPSEDRESGVPERALAEAAERGRASEDRWLVRKDGSRFWASIAVSSVHDRQGRLLGFSQRLRDLSRSKGIEQQLRRKQDALELALEAAGLGIWEYDLATGEMHWDGRAKALFGLQADATVTPGCRPARTGSER